MCILVSVSLSSLQPRLAVWMSLSPTSLREGSSMNPYLHTKRRCPCNLTLLVPPPPHQPSRVQANRPLTGHQLPPVALVHGERLAPSGCRPCSPRPLAPPFHQCSDNYHLRSERRTCWSRLGGCALLTLPLAHTVTVSNTVWVLGTQYGGVFDSVDALVPKLLLYACIIL